MGETRDTWHSFKTSYSSAVDTGNRNVEEVVTFIKGFHVPSIKEAANSYEDAASAIKKAKELLKDEAVKLARVWDGKASVEAQTALGILYVTMEKLAEKLEDMQKPLNSLADMVREHKAFVEDTWKGVMPTWANQDIGTWNDDIPDFWSTYTGYFGDDGKVVNQAKADGGSQNNLAGDHLKVFAKDLSHIHQAIPATMKKSLRELSPPEPPKDGPQQITYPTGNTGGPSSPFPSGGADLSGGRNGVGAVNGPDLGAYDPSTGFVRTPGVDPNAGHPPGTTVPTGSTTPVSSTNPSGTDVPTYPGAGTPPSVGDTPGLNRDPSGDGAGSTTSLADYKPTTPGITSPTSTTSGYNTPTHPTTPGTYGTYGGTSTGGGVVPGQPTSLSTRAGTGVGGGMPFLPMSGAGGAGGGGESKDRESTTWLHEDDDVWGDDTGSVSSRIG